MFLAALSILPCLVGFFYQRPLLLLYMWPVSMLINAIFVASTLGLPGLAQDSIWLLPMDPAYFFTILYLALYASLNPHRFVALLKDNSLLSIFLAVVALYIVIDTPTFGKSAIGEARKVYFMFLLPLLALVVIKKPEELRRFVRVVILSAAFVLLFALASAAMQRTILRVVNSECTLIIALAAFAMLMHRFQRMVVFHPIVDRLLLFLFAAFTIGSGQRSVWLAVGLGLLLLLSLHITRRTLMIKIAVAGLAFTIAMGTAFVVFPEAGVRLGARFMGIINPSSDATASWRIDGWRQQLARIKSSGRLLFGEGFGGYNWWKAQGAFVLASPHNAYVQLLLKLGLFGLAIYGLLAFEFFHRAWGFRKKLPRGPMKTYLDMGILNFGAGHAFMLGYSGVPVMLMFFAVALCAIKLSANLHRVTTRSPVHAGRLRRIGWQLNMLTPRTPITPYER